MICGRAPDGAACMFAFPHCSSRSQAYTSHLFWKVKKNLRPGCRFDGWVKKRCIATHISWIWRENRSSHVATRASARFGEFKEESGR